MRDFRFRAWDGERMYYGVVPWHWDFVISLSRSRCERSTGPGFLGSGGKEADFLVPGIAFKELMQFTGLKDKNGKEIYEGDILKFSGYLTGAKNQSISWDNKSASYVLSDMMPMLINAYSKDCITVIGNIYENPELLKEGK